MRGDLKRLKRETESGRVVAEEGSAGSAPSASHRLSLGVCDHSAIGLCFGIVQFCIDRRSPAQQGQADRGGCSFLVLLVAAGFGVYKLLVRNAPAIDTRNISIRPLTDHGQVVSLSASRQTAD